MKNATAAARASFYHLFAMAFDHPVPELYASINNGELQNQLRQLQHGLAIDETALPVLDCGFQRLESDYIALFDLAREGKERCSLQEYDYVKVDEVITEPEEGISDRNALFKTLLRFYHHFGLKITEDTRERVLPDHLSCQLEILSYLCFRQQQAIENNTAAAGYYLAQRDFLQRHLGVWLPRFVKRLRHCRGDTEVDDFYDIAANVLLIEVESHSAECQGYPRDAI